VFNIITSKEEIMFNDEQEMSWTHEAIAGIELALGGNEPRVCTALSDEDLSHVPTFGAVVERT